MISLYNTASILDDSKDYIMQFIALIVISCICYSVGAIWLTKKDIPV